jgi:hypothetical protein
LQRTEGGSDLTEEGFAEELGFGGGDDLVNGANGLLGALGGGWYGGIGLPFSTISILLTAASS